MILVESTADLPNRIANYAAGRFAVVRIPGSGETCRVAPGVPISLPS